MSSGLEGESHLRQARKIAGIASWELDIESGDLLWSKEAFRIFNIPEGTSLSYEGFLQSVLPEDRDYVAQKWQAALNGEPYDIEHRIRAGKEIKWVREKAHLEFDNMGHAVRAVGIVQDITVHKEAEEELSRAKINYRMIADYTYDWEWWKDPDGTFRYVSPSCERITGYEADRFIQNHSLLREIIVPEDRYTWDTHNHESHKDIGLREMQFRIKRADGEVRWIEHACQPVFAGDNKFLGIRGSNRDITARRQAEEALQSAKINYRMIADYTYDWEWWKDPDGTFRYVSPSCERITGYEADRFIQNHSLLREIIVPEDRDRWDTHNHESHKDIGLREMVFRIKKADGEVRWIEHACQPVFTREDKFLGIRASNRDITARRQAEEELRANRQRLIKAQEIAHLGFLDWNLKTNEIVWSGEVYDIFGVDPGVPATLEQTVGLVHPDDREFVNENLDKATKGLRDYSIDHRVVRPDGKVVWVQARGDVERDKEGVPVALLGTVVDITERKLADLKLKESFAEISSLKEQLERESLYLREEIKLEHDYNNIIGNSDAIKYVLFKVEQVAETDSNVLIQGETGTGKELIARAIHDGSQRKDRPLVKVNCAALPANLIESELFGHERGAFTSAHARQLGRFEVADGSSIFLDEIGELPLELQAKLLRVIEDREYERLGSSKTMKVDVRIIAATNRNIEKDVQEGLFRKDLWYRLSVIPLTVPPLRERVEDIPLIAQHYLDLFARKLGKKITSVPKKTIQEMQSYDWPGNVRELANVVERAVINTSGSKLKMMEKLVPRQQPSPGDYKALRDMERDYIVQVLEKTGWKVSGKNSAAEILDLDRSTLRHKIKILGIHKP